MSPDPSSTPDATPDAAAESLTDSTTSDRKWKPLGPTQRRVVGVLIEKAKTTPEQYPLSLNALTNGCNQKNNRHPLTNLTQDQVEQTIQELRELGAVVEVQGSWRVPKYKHLMYEWLGVDKAELAVMAELLLRGAQTVGELRARAARMEPIPDQTTLRPILQSLKTKGLLLELSAEGRGQVVSHNLYKDREMAELRSRAVALSSAQLAEEVAADEQKRPAPADEALPLPLRSISRAPAVTPVTLDMFNELQVELAELRAEVARLRGVIEQLTG